MRRVSKQVLDVLTAITASEHPVRKRAHAAHQAHVARVRGVLHDANVIGVGISEKTVQGQGTRVPSLCFYVGEKRRVEEVPAAFHVPPVLASADGRAVFTDVKEIGHFHPGALAQNAPIQSGYSVSNAAGGTGTVGAIVQREGDMYLLSNSHVLARSGLASLGEHILFPGRGDLGTDPTNWVADLSDFICFDHSGDFVNDSDAAVAQIRSGSLPVVSQEIPNASAPPSVMDVATVKRVTLQGRSSGMTTGEVLDRNFCFTMTYPGVGELGFRNQVLCTRYTEDGDSGALVLDADSGSIVGLHFGHSPRGSVFNPIGPIMEKLRFTFE